MQRPEMEAIERQGRGPCFQEPSSLVPMKQLLISQAGREASLLLYFPAA